MTEPLDPDLIALATPYALHAVPEAELADIERRVAAAPPDVAQAFDDEVRAVRETMAVVSAATAVEPPDQLRDRLLTEVSSDPVRALRPRIKRWQTVVLAAAAALVIGLGALGVGMALRPAPSPSTAEQVFAAPDVRTVSGQIPTGGTATVVFSREKNAGVLVMNNVAPPTAGHRLPDVADRRQGTALGRDDGRQERRAVDHRGPARSRRLADAGVHRRTPGWFSAAHQPALRQAALGLRLV